MPEWIVSPGLTGYADAVATMETRVDAIARGHADEAIWLVEHPPLYTAGTSTHGSDLVNDHGLPVHRSSRGGQLTWHGPGQRVVYIMLDLNRRGRDLRAFVGQIETWVVTALGRLGIKAGTHAAGIGVWVGTGTAHPAKIAAIGLRLRRWVSYHGVAINVAPDLSFFDGIVPCGIQGLGVTSLARCKTGITMAAVDSALLESFAEVFSDNLTRLRPQQVLSVRIQGTPAL